MQVIQDGVGDHFENGAYYEIINFWSIFKCNTSRITKFWSENSFLGSLMRLGTRKGGKSKMAAMIQSILINFC